jgi:CRISPR/Cas system CSM-associated protein Csm2 small subunit
MGGEGGRDDLRKWGIEALKVRAKYIKAAATKTGELRFNWKIVSAMNRTPEESAAVRRHTEARMAKEFAEAQENYEAASEAVVAARNAFSELEGVVNSQIRKFLLELRDLRMAIHSELATVTSDMKDLRAFALAPEHEQEVRRLRELCDLCDRLRALHASGLLDAVTGTIMTLMEGERGTQGRQGTGAVRATQERSESSD